MTARVFTHAHLVTGCAEWPDGFIRFTDTVQAVGPMTAFVQQPGDAVQDVGGDLIVPGFIDVHVHGGYGVDAMDGDPTAIAAMATRIAAAEGVTTIFPTTMTQAPEAIDRAVAGIAAAAERTPLIAGIHLEGPFIAPAYKGAQPAAFIQPATAAAVARWQSLARGMIRLITYAPEVGDPADFEAYCQAHGIALAIGHSDATRARLVTCPARHVTHLYNAQRLAVHREPGVMGHALLEDGITAEIIADGFHNAPDMVKLAYRVKGAARLELVTDAMRAKGLGDGVSELGGQTVTVQGVEARLADGTIAGSVLPFITAFVNIQRFTGAGVAQAVQMASVNQAQEFGLSQKGVLEPGRDADLNRLTPDQKLVATFSRGRLIERMD
ncbi:N-acetylglucosamine-6-phosphate deacetylase [Lacticaseibacillus kribbianus]|uniref:N-acetylglucosamine-6-phosphate deacetylase n=1 Tax=Lacticaseibacillus kribbianus TaxID=2926292 RepID=UPI001CD1FA5C|nr:N-acetylglucosamine-6-phosphate deacetylase [Lacticaseibacillus kribbianus]